jgi:hypothetical protein
METTQQTASVFEGLGGSREYVDATCDAAQHPDRAQAVDGLAADPERPQFGGRGDAVMLTQPAGRGG